MSDNKSTRINETKTEHLPGQHVHNHSAEASVGYASAVFDGVRTPDSEMANDLTQLIRDTENDLLFCHSTRVYLFGALTGKRRALKFDPELLYVGAMFHDIGLTGIPEHKKPEVALVTSGVEMDVLGLAYDEFTDA